MGPWSFRDPAWLLLLVLPLVLLAVEARTGGRWHVGVPTLVHLRGLAKSWRSTARRALPALRAAGLAALVVALARPIGDRARMPVDGEGIDIALVVDVSGSMKMEDLAPGRTRLDVVKDVLRRFVKERHGDRMGIIAFARFPHTICPFTLDGDTVATFVDRLQPVELPAEDGTAIGVALAQASRRLKKSTAKSRIVVLITDGANNVEDVMPEEASRMAASLGIRAYTVLAGRERAGAQFRVEGEAESKTLIDIARATGGRFFRADDARALQDIYEEIDRLEKTRFEEKKYESFTDLFRPFALGGALLLMAAAIADHTWLRRLP